MNKREKEYYSNINPIAGLCLSNWGGIEILDIIGGECVVYRFNYGEPGTPHRAKIYVGVNVSSFRAGRLTIRLNDCIRY